MRKVLPNLLLLLACAPAVGPAAEWKVAVQVHEATSLTDDDADGPDDMYWDVQIGPTKGAGAPTHCNRQDDHDDDNNHITPSDWICSATITGGNDVTAQIVLTLMEHDTTSADDEFDINPAPGQLGLLMYYTPQTTQISIAGVPGQDAPHCAHGRMTSRGWSGDDQAEVIFSVSASDVGAPDGDSDGDGLLDSWEVCGIDGDKDDVPEVNIAAMGANRYRKDIFVEIDWMAQPNTGLGMGPAHTHAPWLPSLVNAWNELNIAPVSTPGPGGASNGGIALHVDTGTLYDSYTVDHNGDGTPELVVPMGGNFDVNGDGMPDIGALGALSGTPGGGNQLAEVALLSDVGGDNFAAGTDFANIKAANFYAPRDSVFHYAVFGHFIDTISSSGIAEPCGSPSCNDFIVSLGGFFNPVAGLPRQTVDADLDGRPDTGGAIINGPGGLPVDGTFADHTGTFLHELGHNLSLHHGGKGDTINYKPNFLSIMNYAWQTRGIGFDFNGDDRADQVGVSFDGDGVNDAQRFLYSGDPLTPVLGPLNEAGMLDENFGVTTAASTTLASFTCPPPPATPPPANPNPGIRERRADRPMNWNCNANASETGVTADINNVELSSNAIETLNGADDYLTIRTDGLDFNRGLTAKQKIERLSNTQRIISPGREFQPNCRKPRRVDFEDIAVGKLVAAQYAPTVTFLADGMRSPEIVDGPGRNNVPTQSPKRSLVNRLRSGDPQPLVVNFSPAQRAVSFFYGHAGLGRTERSRARMVLRARDQNGLPMGKVEQPLPPPGSGVTNYVIAVPVWPDEAISQIEVSYEADSGAGSTIFAEPVIIDDLVVCPEFKKENVAPPLAKPPQFGSRTANLAIRSENIHAVPAPDGDPDHFAYQHMTFSGLTVNVNGAVGTTGFDLTRPEGSKLTVTAPSVFGGRRFLYWKHSSGAQFGIDNNSIPFTLLANGTLTAVYEGRGVQPHHPPGGGGRDGHGEGPCRCVPCCPRGGDHRHDERRPSRGPN